MKCVIAIIIISGVGISSLANELGRFIEDINPFEEYTE